MQKGEADVLAALVPSESRTQPFHLPLGLPKELLGAASLSLSPRPSEKEPRAGAGAAGGAAGQGVLLRGAGSPGAPSQLLHTESSHGEPALEPNARLALEALLSCSRLGQVTKG